MRRCFWLLPNSTQANGVVVDGNYIITTAGPVDDPVAAASRRSIAHDGVTATYAASNNLNRMMDGTVVIIILLWDQALA